MEIISLSLSLSPLLSLTLSLLIQPDRTQYKAIVSKQCDTGTVNRRKVKNRVPRNRLTYIREFSI